MELLALTGAAVQPLLLDSGSDTELAVQNMEDEPLGSWAPSHSVFSPLTGRSSPHHVTNTDYTQTPPNDHTLTPPTDHTPSPLTITARDLCPARGRGRENSESLSSWQSLSPLTLPAFQSRSTPQHPTASTPPMLTPVTPHHTPGTPHATGHVRIKISAKKLREVASPLLTPPPKLPQKSVDQLESVSLHSLPSCESPESSECSTPRALVHQPPLQHLSVPPSPSPSLSPSPSGVPLQARVENQPNEVRATDKCKSLVQGTMRSSHHCSQVDTSLENSVIVSQIESPQPTSAAKEKLLQQQAWEKKMSQFKVIRPQVIRQQEATVKTILGEKDGKTRHEPGSASPGLPQKARRVGGERHRGIPLPEPVATNDQERPGTGMTRLPVSSIPPPRHPIPSQLDSEPLSSVFPENAAHRGDSVSPPRKTLGRPGRSCPPPVGGRGTNRTVWHRQTRHKRPPRVSSRRNHAPGVSPVSTDGSRPRVISRPTNRASLSKSSPQPPPTSLPPSSFPPLPPHLPGNPLPPSVSNYLPLDFQETVRLVASCAAAATAAALATQRNSGDEASAMKDRLRGNCLSHHLTSGQPPFKLDFAPGPPWSTEVGERKRGRGSEADGIPQGRRPTGVKEPPVEKKTEAFTVAPQESQWCGGVGRPGKQPSPLSNQTLRAGKHSEKTQNGAEFWRQDPRGSSPRDYHMADGDNNDAEGSGPETSRQDLSARDERVASPPCHEAEKPRRCGLTQQKERDLLRVERMFLGIQQARRDLEARGALAEIQSSWSDPAPPLPSNEEDPAHLGVPQYRVATFMNQLKDSSTSGHNDREEKLPAPVEEQGVVASRKRASGKKTGKNKKPSLREGRLHPERGKVGDDGSTAAYQHTTETTTDREPRNENRGPIPLPTVPLRVLPMGPPGGVSLVGYTLRPHPGGTGVVMCDPSTGVPIMTSSGGVPLVGLSAGVPSVPQGPQMVLRSIPPVIHMPTAIPLGHTSTSPTVPPPPATVAPVGGGQSEDQQEGADSTGGPSVADVGLQTSFTAENTPRLVQEVLPPLDISTSQSAESTAENPTPHNDDDIEPFGISLPGNHTGLSPSEDERPAPPRPPACRHLEEEMDKDLSAEKVSHKIMEYLENEGKEWATRELLTRVLAAARDRSHEMSCDQNPGHRLVDSPNSCSTCALSPPSHPPRPFTSVPSHTDIATAAGGVGDVWESVWGRGGGGVCEGARGGGVVEAVVREVLREKVTEALREFQSCHDHEEEERDGGEKTVAVGSENEESVCSSGSSQSTPRVPTPSLSPPPTSPSLPPLPPSPPPPDEDSSLHSPLPQLATPTATPPISRKSDSTETSPRTIISTPQETKEDVSATTPEGPGNTYSKGNLEELSPLATPTLSPPHQTPPTPTPPSPTTEPDEPTPTPSQPPPKQLSLSESSSSSSSTSPTTTGTETHPPHPHSLTTVTNLTTDQEISTGECLLQRLPQPGAGANSLSEGEGALSPGDARWYSTYATKMDPLQNQTNNKRKKMLPAGAAFLERKSSPDSLSDTSGHSSSFQSDTNVLSEGEVRGKGRRGAGDPLDRFLANLRSSPGHDSPSSSSSSSTPLNLSSSRDNTPSDLLSVISRDSQDSRHSSLSGGEVRGREERNSTPLRPPGRGEKGIRRTPFTVGLAGEGMGSRGLPYHRRFPLEQTKSASPGEARAQDSRKGKKSDLSVGFVHSEGELDPVLRGHPVDNREKKATQQPLQETVAASSPGEIRVRLTTRNKTRDGIDVIRISHRSHQNSSSGHSPREVDKPPSQDTTSASVGPHSFPSSLSDSPALVQHGRVAPVRRRLRVSSELGPTRVITVSPAPPALSSDDKEAADDARYKEFTAQDSKDNTPIGNGATRSDKITELNLGEGEAPTEEDMSPDATRPPPLESFISPSPSPPLQTTPPPPPQTTPPSLPQTTPLHIKPGPLPSDATDIGLTPRSFWDTGPPQPANPPPAARGKAQVGGSSVSPGRRTQLQISVPTGITSSVGEESPPLSPAYSSDFEFSSISQPTFD